MDYNNYSGYSPYMPFDGTNIDQNPMPDQNLFNPSMQYEQAYMYYRYLTQQMDYKIKCREYENLTRNDKKS